VNSREKRGVLPSKEGGLSTGEKGKRGKGPEENSLIEENKRRHFRKGPCFQGEKKWASKGGLEGEGKKGREGEELGGGKGKKRGEGTDGNPRPHWTTQRRTNTGKRLMGGGKGGARGEGEKRKKNAITRLGNHFEGITGNQNERPRFRGTTGGGV